MKLTANADKCKFTYNDQRIGFDGKCMLSFGNGFVWNVNIFGVYNASSSHAINQKLANSLINTDYCLLAYELNNIENVTNFESMWKRLDWYLTSIYIAGTLSFKGRPF